MNEKTNDGKKDGLLLGSNTHTKHAHLCISVLDFLNIIFHSISIFNKLYCFDHSIYDQTIETRHSQTQYNVQCSNYMRKNIVEEKNV